MLVWSAALGPAARASGPTYLPEMPPQQALYRDGWTNRYLLDGTWLYRADYSNLGVAQGWWKNIAATGGWSPVQVPNAYNAGDFSEQSMLGYVGWYRKDFLLPRGPRGRLWIVRFESVNYRAEIWLNGHLLGTHTGAYLPFELYLSHLHAGVNRLIVRVDDRRSPSDIPPGPSGGWWNYGGIVREVYLRPVERADLAQVIVRPLLPCPTCTATIEEQVLVHNVTGAPQSVRLRGSYGKVPVDFGEAKIAPHSSWTAQASVRITHPRLWSIYQPTLYRATVDLYGADGRRLNSYVTYSGIRSITVTAGGLLELNGRVLHLRGAHIQEQDLVLGSALDPAHLQRLMSWVRMLGAHLIRAHYPLNPQILELADEYGILVWSEIPVNNQSSPYIGEPAVKAQALQMLRENILTNENHPSVMLWSIGNELSTPTTAPETAYIASAAALAHSLDPTRPVGMAISDWPGLACQSAYAPLDALGFNDYFGWFDAGGGATDDRDELSPFLDSFRACYPHKALFVTEFGFDANRSGPVEERGTYQFQANSAAFHLGVFATKPWLAGAVYFVLQDFASSPQYSGGNPWPDPPFNQKGLIDLYGNFKAAFAVVSAIYHATVQLGPPPANASGRARVRAGPARASPAAVRTLSVRVGPSVIGRPVAPGFVGASMEYRWLSAYTGSDPRGVNPVLVKLLRNLVGGRPGFVLRIGGDSTDWTWWPIPGMARPAGVSFTLTPRWIAVVHGLATALGARVILGIDLEAGSPRLAAGEARALIAGVGRSRIAALEVGNEPEAYPLRWYVAKSGQVVPGRPAGYGFTQYSKEFSQVRRSLGKLPLAGPATGSLGWLAGLSRFIATEPTLRVVTVHRYPLSRCVTNPTSAQYPAVSNLLSRVSSRGLAAGIGHYAVLAHRGGALLRVDELNSVTCHGKPGVSDTFASALWMLDTLFEMVRAGVDGVNIHTWTGAAANELFTFQRRDGRWLGSVRPVYYGALMFTRAAPPGSRLLQTHVSAGGPVDVWATKGPDGIIHVVAINESLSGAYRVLVRVPAGATAALVQRLAAPTAYAPRGVTLAGQSFGSETDTGNLSGPLRSTVVAPIGGSYSVRLPAASAAMLTVGPTV